MKDAQNPIGIAIEMKQGYTSVFYTHIYGTEEMFAADYRYIERMVKFLLWAVGGYRIYTCGNSKIASELQKEYRCDGRRSFDWNTMKEIY